VSVATIPWARLELVDGENDEPDLVQVTDVVGGRGGVTCTRPTRHGTGVPARTGPRSTRDTPDPAGH